MIALGARWAPRNWAWAWQASRNLTETHLPRSAAVPPDRPTDRPKCWAKSRSTNIGNPKARTNRTRAKRLFACDGKKLMHVCWLACCRIKTSLILACHPSIFILKYFQSPQQKKVLSECNIARKKKTSLKKNEEPSKQEEEDGMSKNYGVTMSHARLQGMLVSFYILLRG